MFSATSVPVEIVSPLPPFTSGSCLAFFASSFRGLSSSGFLYKDIINCESFTNVLTVFKRTIIKQFCKKKKKKFCNTCLFPMVQRSWTPGFTALRVSRATACPLENRLVCLNIPVQPLQGWRERIGMRNRQQWPTHKSEVESGSKIRVEA